MRLKGLSVIEVLIVVGAIAILGAVTIPNLIGYRRAQDLDLDAQRIAFFIRDAQARAITQEDITPDVSEKWGIHFDNPSIGSGFYEVFRGVTYPGTRASKNPLKSTIEFDPASIPIGIPVDLFFINTSGLPLMSKSITIRLKGATCPDVSKCKTVNVNSNGTITY